MMTRSPSVLSSSLRAWWQRDVTASPVNLLSDADRDYQTVQRHVASGSIEPDAGGRVSNVLILCAAIAGVGRQRRLCRSILIF